MMSIERFFEFFMKCYFVYITLVVLSASIDLFILKGKYAYYTGLLFISCGFIGIIGLMLFLIFRVTVNIKE